MKNNYDLIGAFVVLLGAIATIGSIFAAWATHVIVCIQTGSWILLIVGIFVPPIGWVHGVGSWFGLF